MSKEMEQQQSNVSRKSCPHIMMVSFPTMGHIRPMHRFAINVARHGAVVTLATFSHAFPRLLSLPSHPNLRLASIPDLLSADEARDYIRVIYHVIDNIDGSELESLIQRLNANEDTPPVSCIVYNHFIYWARTVAEKLQIPTAMFWTQSASIFATYFHFVKHEAEEGYFEGGKGFRIPGFRTKLESEDLPDCINPKDENVLKHFRPQFEDLENVQWVLANTFDDLEQDAFRFIRSNAVRFLGIGPCISPSASASLAEKEGYLKWLDLQPASSVVYVAFGSVTVFSQKQVEEMACGIRNSGAKFLWVLRGMTDMIPPGFADETKETGLMVEWCDQVRVLGHPAVGGFVTHCGWNSSLESVCAGVPVATFPVWSDQYTNSKFLCEDFKTGMKIRNVGKKETVGRAEFERCIRILLGGSEGAEMRKKAQKWKEKAEMAVSGCGSSTLNLSKFVEGVSKWTEAKSL